MRRYIPAFLILCLLLSGAAAFAEGNLLVNGDFETSDGGWPSGWYEDAWLRDEGVSYVELREGGRDGGLCLMIENVVSNDARLVQDIDVQPGATYRLSGWVKADGIDTTFAGASITVLHTYASFPEVHDTAGEWVLLEAYVRTANDHTRLTIGPRLGDYSADNAGIAYFDDVAFELVEEVPAGAEVMQLYNYSNSQSVQTHEDAVPTEGKSISIYLMVGGFVLILLVLAFLRKCGTPLPKAAIWVLLLVAALVRLYLMATQPGYESDMNCFYSWSLRMAEVGPNAFYSPDVFCDYPPGYMYLLWATGGLLNLLGVTNLNETARVIVKFMPLLADLAAVYLIWRLASKKLGNTPALLLAALYAISPAVLIDGAIWGQVDAVLALGLLATVVFAVRGKWLVALPVFTVTVLMKPQALMAAPIGLVALIVDIVPWKKGGKKVALDALVGLGASAGVAVVMLLPFLWGKEAPFAWIVDKYATTLGSYEYATLNTPNLYYLMGANWLPLETAIGPLTYGSLGTALMVIVVLGTMALYVWRRDRDTLPFFCALIYIGLYLFGIKMHERYLFPALLLLLYAYVRRPDWRLLALFAGFSVTFYINCAIVLRDTHMALGFDVGGMILSGANMLLFALAMWVALDKKARPLPEYRAKERAHTDRLAALEGKTPPMAKMRRKDWVAMLGLTVVYALIAFIGLGSFVAPQTVWSSSGASEQLIIDLGETHDDFTFMYYVGINGRDHTFEYETSDDAINWSEPIVGRAYMGDCFRWITMGERYWNERDQKYEWQKESLHFSGRYIRIACDGPALTLMEVAFMDAQGALLPVASVESLGSRPGSAKDTALLIDEQDVVPAYPSYYNGTYFDEIYHARTGYEHANELSTYEWTHPPLGKIFIMIGIKLFGMVPFGWRFMGALTGVLMVPAMYMMGKLLFKKSRYAFLAAFVMAFDMMHLTQTRIATIDSYAVLFIILMYFFMFRYLQMSFFRDGWRTLIPLGLSGLFMGLGCASKWICMYAAVGLAVLFAWSMVQRFLEWRAGVREGGEPAERVAKYPQYLIGTLGFCLAAFIAVPFAIYYFSYIPHFAFDGGLTWQRFWDTQVGIFGYHANLVDSHPFQSPWYEWPLMLKPMYYFDGKPFVGPGMISSIMCMGNPAVWWVGLVAFFYVVWRWMKPHLKGEAATDHRPALLLLAFAAQFLPWVLVPRSTFIYHYFGSLPFVMLCIVFAAEQLWLHRPKLAKIVQIVYMAVVVLLFIGFYPLATGVAVPLVWGNIMNWLRFMYLPGWQYKGWLYY